jgi:Predicted dehydrogenases and related proteins
MINREDKGERKGLGLILMDAREKIRFGMIGTNSITKKFLEAASLSKEFELAALYSRSLKNGRAYILDLERAPGSENILGPDGVRVFDSLKDLAESANIDAVYIASPNSFHASQSILMLENRKHVLCEKPAASNSREWESMKKAAALNSRVVLEAMRPLFTPSFQLIKELLQKIAPVREVYFSFCQYSSRYDNFKAGIIENAFRPELSNGAIMDIGIYCIALLAGLFGRPKRIFAEGQILPGSIDGMGKIIAQYEGMHAELVYSKIADSETPCEIRGENGTIWFPRIGAPENIRINYRNGAEEIFPGNVIQQDILYELEAFIGMIKGQSQADIGDEKTAASGKFVSGEYNAISDIVIEILDEARRQIGIVFPADI